MNKDIKNIKLYVKDTLKAKETEKIVREELLNNGFMINDNNYDLVISIGGDGTFLKMLHHHNLDNKLYYTSINAGSLGFLSTAYHNQVKEFINKLKNRLYIIKPINVLKTVAYTNNESKEFSSINELTIRKSDFSCLKCDIYIDNKLLDKFVGDGLMISTSIGSTAYNLVLGGSIIDNELKVLSITPIAPLNNKVYKSLINSLVLSKKRRITIILNYNKVSLVSDGKVHELNDVKKIEFMLSDNYINYLLTDDYNYIDNIKSKIIDSGE